MTRLQTLRARRERLIELNNIHHFTQTNNADIDRYYRMMLSIRREINDIQCKNVRKILDNSTDRVVSGILNQRKNFNIIQ